MHETELCVQEVQIEMQTLATLPPDYQLVCRMVAMHHERLAGFQHREDANQTAWIASRSAMARARSSFETPLAFVVADSRYS